ncbi:MAG TPA: lysylphosphatidylglycerol synthase domain-containing protein [Nitrososphaerales archaeon]|nr:lysylphosphatidylglycerol synthase domain-containing protein [Nitrososphaerales archaeon]
MGDEKSTSEYQLPKSVMKWVALGLLLTSAVVIAISILSGVKLSDLTKLGYLTFALAAGVCASKLLVQILRFRVITLGLAGDPKPNISGLALTRVASEFVSLSTPATSMGIFILTSWLTGKGIEAGKALSICYFQVLIEIYVGAGLAILAGVLALTRGALVIGSTILLVATVLIAGYTIIFIIPALKGIKVPHFVFTLSSYLIGGPRANALYLRAVVGSLNFSLSAHAIMKRESLPVVVKAVGLTIIEDFLAGAALWIILNASGLKIDLASSTLAAYGVVAVAQIPVSIGGAGITELTMKSYLTTVYGFSTWAPVVLWRIATYQVLLAITGIVFVFFVRKATKGSIKTPRNAGLDPSASKPPRTTAAEGEKEVVKPERRYGVVKTLRFAVAGAVGFGVTEVALTIGLLVFFGNLSIGHASFASPALLGLDVLSLVIGVSASFLVNERITVRVPETMMEEAKRFKRFLKFQAVSGVGNAGIIVVQLVLLATLEVSPLLGTVIGAIATYPVVYFISIKYVWRGQRTR